jgi:glycosyltransferase involved in cell wall biosynthesis
MRVSGDAPRISVVLTTYNRAHVLPTTLDGILSQTCRDFELIVSDDCSPDHTEELCREYMRRDPRVRYRRNPRNLRMPGNLNAAIAETRGEYIANLHDGDLYRADLLEKWSGALDRHRNAAFVFNQYSVGKPGGPTRLHALDLPECIGGHEFLLRHFTTQWGSPVFGTVMARKACYNVVGPFDPRYSFNSDIEMWMRLALRYDVAYVAEPLIRVTPREKVHLMSNRHLWERTVDIRVKRRALELLAPHDRARRLRFEARARAHYAALALPALRHARWAELRQALFLAASGRDEIPPPY